MEFIIISVRQAGPGDFLTWVPPSIFLFSVFFLSGTVRVNLDWNHSLSCGSAPWGDFRVFFLLPEISSHHLHSTVLSSLPLWIAERWWGVAPLNISLGDFWVVNFYRVFLLFSFHVPPSYSGLSGANEGFLFIQFFGCFLGRLVQWDFISPLMCSELIFPWRRSVLQHISSTAFHFNPPPHRSCDSCLSAWLPEPHFPWRVGGWERRKERNSSATWASNLRQLCKVITYGFELKGVISSFQILYSKHIGEEFGQYFSLSLRL